MCVCMYVFFVSDAHRMETHSSSLFHISRSRRELTDTELIHSSLYVCVYVCDIYAIRLYVICQTKNECGQLWISFGLWIRITFPSTTKKPIRNFKWRWIEQYTNFDCCIFFNFIIEIIFNDTSWQKIKIFILNIVYCNQMLKLIQFVVVIK